MVYNEFNLNKISDPNKILYFKIYKEGNAYYIGAMLVNGKGEYERVAITKPSTNFMFPSEPIYVLYKENKMLSYLNNFVSIENQIAFNKSFLEGFGYADVLDNPKEVATFARFKDGSTTLIGYCNKKKFEKKLIYKLRKLLYENGIEPGYDKSYDRKTDFIESYLKDNTAIIPELQDSDDLENN